LCAGLFTCHLPDFYTWQAFCNAAFIHNGVESKRVTIVEGKMALLYLIISAMITFFYVDDQNIDRLKHAINALALTQIHAATE